MKQTTQKQTRATPAPKRPAKSGTRRNASAATMPPDWQQAQERIKEFANLKENWDGYDGHRPDTADIRNAQAVLKRLWKLGATVPRVSAAGDGEILFAWDLPNKGYLQISLVESLLGYIARSPEGKEPSDEYEFSSELGGRLGESLEAFIGRHIMREAKGGGDAVNTLGAAA